MGEVWLIDTEFAGSGLALCDGIQKVIVIGGSGGADGWPGPLKSAYPWSGSDSITEATCPPGGWRNGACCPNGRVNSSNQVFSWDGGGGRCDNPANGAVPIFCYDTIDRALTRIA